VTKGKQPELKELACAEVLLANRLSIREPSSVTIRDYEQAIRSGAEFPPIDVTLINGAHYLVDGQHRLRATQGTGRTTIMAWVHRLTWAQASAKAAVANTTHGRPLRGAEKSKALAAFLRDPANDSLSLQDVVDALGGAVSRSTVRNYRNKARGSGLRGSSATPMADLIEAGKEAAQDRLREEGERRLADLVKLYGRMEDPERRHQFLEDARAALERMVAQGNAHPGPLDI